MTWTIYIKFRSPFPVRLHIIFGFDWPSGFRGAYTNSWSGVMEWSGAVEWSGIFGAGFLESMQVI